MKILAIRGRNLASLEGEFEIDFTKEPLLSAGIYAISGPTGSGKSTILDTICLALFSKTPRTEQAKEINVKVKDINDDTLVQGDPRFILRRGTASGYAEVDFLALNGHPYRARWSILRAREKENGRLQSPRLTLYNISTGEEEQGNRSELQARIIDLIGLTFDQFTRSVLLAQNDFSTFLKAEQGEKASLLEKLTGTEQYSAISRLIFEKNCDAKEAYNKIRLQIEGIELLPEEEEKNLCISLQDTNKLLQRLEKLKGERKVLQDAIKSAEQLIEDKQKQLKDATDKLNKANELVLLSQKANEEKKIALQQLETSYKKIQPEIQQARKLDIQLELAQKDKLIAEQTLHKAYEGLKEKEIQLTKLISEQQKRIEEIARLNQWIEKYKSKENTVNQHTVLLIHLDNALKAHLLKTSAEKNLNELKNQIEELNLKTNNLQLPDNFKDVERITKAINEYRLKREELIIEQTRFVTSGDIKALRGKLMEGMPCPVCGSTEHPYASAKLLDKLLGLGDEIKTITDHIEQLTKLSGFIDQKNKITQKLPYEEKEIKRQEEVITNALSAANSLFGYDSWQDNWQRDPVAFRNALDRFAKEWKQNIDTLQQLDNMKTGSEAERKSYESFIVTLQKQVNETQKAYDAKLTVLGNIQTERFRLLQGRKVNSVEKEYTEKIDTLKMQLDELLKTQTEQSRIADQSKGNVEQINKDLTKTMNDLSNHNKALEEWTKAYNNSFDEVRSLDEWLNETIRLQTEYSFLLRKQEECKQQIVILQKELSTKQTISERWAKLNDLAGSADGAKFRRIAQGYTLDVLLNYANVQLRNLTGRYRLERVPDTLALQVIDRDMCDEVRTVHSLSGGESFLVSLALALGLSSLSSNRMKVESLFIDEGFGFLDTDTLRVALDALENLRTQGRKIGVISHVQEMTERIPVQIKVTPAGSGRSYIH